MDRHRDLGAPIKTQLRDLSLRELLLLLGELGNDSKEEVKIINVLQVKRYIPHTQRCSTGTLEPQRKIVIRVGGVNQVFPVRPNTAILADRFFCLCVYVSVCMYACIRSEMFTVGCVYILYCSHKYLLR